VAQREALVLLETEFVSPAGYVAEISPVYLNFTHFRLTDRITESQNHRI